MLALIIGLSLTAGAQEKRDTIRAEKKEAAHQKLKNELGLSDDQAAKLKATNDEFKTKRRELKDNTSLSKEEKQKQSMALLEERRKKINEFLTPEQQEKYKLVEKEQIKKHYKKGKKEKAITASPQ